MVCETHRFVVLLCKLDKWDCVHVIELLILYPSEILHDLSIFFCSSRLLDEKKSSLILHLVKLTSMLCQCVKCISFIFFSCFPDGFCCEEQSHCHNT